MKWSEMGYDETRWKGMKEIDVMELYCFEMGIQVLVFRFCSSR